MKILVLACGLLVFAAIAIAVRYHFVSERSPPLFLVLSVLSGVSIVCFARELWLRPKDTVLLAVGLGLIVLGAALFAWALQVSRSARLKLIFDADNPRHILRIGPYRFIRHPFYSSYILFWTGCAVASLHPVSIAYAVALVPLLVFAAHQEESGFDRSALAPEYAAYRRTAGMLWPKLI